MKDIKCFALEVTSKCNLQCSYCYLEESGDEVMSNEIADKAVSILLNNIVIDGFNEPSIIFMGGEPLLNFSLIKYITTKKDNECSTKKIKYFMTTNATIINLSVANFLNTNNILLNISLDGSRLIHNFCRKYKNGKGSFDDVVKGLSLIDSNRKVVRATFTTDFLESFKKDTIDFFESIDQELIYFIFPAISKNITIDIAKIIDIANLQIDHAFEQIRAKKEIKNGFIMHIIEIFFKSIKLLHPCQSLKSYYGLCTDGTIVPCHRFYKHKEYEVGHIDTGLSKKYLHYTTNNSVDQRNACKSCDMRYFCGGGCYYDSLLMYSDLNIVEPTMCSYRYNMFKSVLKNIFKLKKDNYESYLSLKERYNLKHKCVDIMNNQPLLEVMNKIYFKNKNTLLVDLDTDGIIINKNKHVLVNATALAIWDLLDGNRTAQQIAQEIANVCEVEFEAIKDDIYGQLAAFQELGLVEEVQTASHA